MITADIIGYTAGIINMMHIAPQLLKSFKTKSTKDISLSYAIIHVVGLSLWVLYGVFIMSYPVIIMHIIETLFALYLVFLKIKYG